MDPHYYNAYIKWSEEDECFTARTEVFPGLIGVGETEDEAIDDLMIVIADAADSLGYSEG